jgi:hypothetical protein
MKRVISMMVICTLLGVRAPWVAQNDNAGTTPEGLSDTIVAGTVITMAN